LQSNKTIAIQAESTRANKSDGYSPLKREYETEVIVPHTTGKIDATTAVPTFTIDGVDEEVLDRLRRQLISS